MFFTFLKKFLKSLEVPLTKKVSVIIYSYFALQKVPMDLENSIIFDK